MIRHSESNDPIGHVVDDLPPLLSGELDRGGLTRVVRHLHGCDACRSDLVDISAANAALRAVAPVLAVESIPVEMAGIVGVARRRRVPVLAGVAAAVVIVVAVASLSFAVGHHRSGRRTIDLVALGTSSAASGTVSMTPTKSAQDMKVSTVDLAAPPRGSFYEVWLFNPATGKMLPVGVLSLTVASNYQLADDLVASYTKVDVSLQQDNGNPAHSNTSVLRASYG
jgi:predicted anti-sigma-YlaC factor YlaD